LSTERDRQPTDPTEDRDSHPGHHEAAEGAALDPRIDLSRDPNPGVPNHAKPDES
jgi:hypothetical protein